MLDLATVTHTQFKPYLDCAFSLTPEGADRIEIRLLEVATLGSFDPERHRRQAFALRFRGPHEPVLPQSIYRLAQGDLGRLDIFLVPIGHSADGMLYEAVFN